MGIPLGEVMKDQRSRNLSRVGTRLQHSVSGQKAEVERKLAEAQTKIGKLEVKDLGSALRKVADEVDLLAEGLGVKTE